MDYARIVGAGYDAIGQRYHAWSHDEADRLRYVAALRDRLPAGSRVLELGCGPGDPATRLLSERHDVVAVELSRGQLALARAHAPRAALVQGDVARLAVRPESVDAIATFYVLGHLPSAAHAPLLASFGRWLRPGGVLVCNVPLTPGEDVGEFLGVEMFFGGIGREASLAALRAGGLDVESVERLGNDENGVFDWVVASRPAAGAATP